MKKLLLLTLAIFPLLVSAQQPVSIVIDTKTAAQLAASSGAKISIESLVSHYNNENKRLQAKIGGNVLAIEKIHSAYQTSLSNIEFLDAESKNIIQIGKLAKNIAIEIADLKKMVGENPQSTMANLKTLIGLSQETYSCLDQCYTIVLRSKIEIPGAVGNTNDGVNLLNPKERLDLANIIIVKLRRIYNICLCMKVQMQYNVGWGRAFMSIIPYDFTLTEVNKAIADDIINKFN